jgi:hypothetical protein
MSPAGDDRAVLLTIQDVDDRAQNRSPIIS